MLNEATRQRLIDASEDWDKIEVKNDKPIPDGVYEASIMEMLITTSKNGNLMLKWQLDITSDGYGFGRKIYMYNNLEGKYAWIAKKNIACAGIELDHLVNLPNKIAEFIEKIVEIELKTNENNNQNCMIIRPVENEMGF